MSKIKSEGKCCYCQKVLNKRGISRHLETHLKEMGKATKTGKPYFHIRVEGGIFFLQLLISKNTHFEKLDDFLRQIWLECCGHMSQFGDWNNKIGMRRKAGEYFSKGFQTTYTYDFGSSTELTIKVIGEHVTLNEKKDIILLSRNEPLEVYCHVCEKQPVKHICSIHWGEGPFCFCESCAETHQKECEDAEYAMMPIYNSPRSGVCGYDGGTIDRERDGTFVLPS